MRLFKYKYFDALGIASSVLCLLHCLIVPLVLVWYSVQTSQTWHLLDYLFIFMAGVAVYFSSKKNPFVLLKFVFWASYTLFSIALILHETVRFAFYISLLASVALVLCHVVNFKFHVQRHHTYAHAE